VSFRRLWAVARKEGLHVLRDPRSLGFALAIPALMLILFGYALTLDVDEVALVVWDRSRTPESRDFLSRFEGSRFFSVREHASSYRQIEEAIDRRRALASLVLPADFARKVRRGEPVRVQLLADGSDPNTATITMGYAQAITLAWACEVSVERAARAGTNPPAPAVDLRPRARFNPELESKNFVIPGLVAVIMMVIAALLTSLTVSREWERGTMEQLISTPVKGVELILGKLLPYFAVGMADLVLAVAMGEFLFGVPLRGNGALLFAVSGVFLVGALSMGMIVSIFTRNQLLSNQLAMVLTFIPAFLLSGFVFPIRNMPVPIRAVTYAVPARYFIAVLRDIYLKGLGLEGIAMQFALLGAFASVVLLVAVVGFHKRLD